MGASYQRLQSHPILHDQDNTANNFVEWVLPLKDGPTQIGFMLILIKPYIFEMLLIVLGGPSKSPIFLVFCSQSIPQLFPL